MRGAASPAASSSAVGDSAGDDVLLPMWSAPSPRPSLPHIATEIEHEDPTVRGGGGTPAAELVSIFTLGLPLPPTPPPPLLPWRSLRINISLIAIDPESLAAA